MDKGLAAALLAVQKECPTLQRDGINPHFGSKYVSLDSLMPQILPILHEHGIVLVQSPSNIGGEPALRTRLVHAESGEALEDTMPLVLDKATAQGQGSAITYARRYSLMSLLGLVTDPDDDGNAASPRRQSSPRQAEPTKDELKARLTPLLKELAELEPRQDWGTWCVEFCERNFQKSSSADLLKPELASLVAELEREKTRLEAEGGPV